MGEPLLTVRTRFRITFVALLAIIIAALAIYNARPPEPKYQGKKLSDWMYGPEDHNISSEDRYDQRAEAFQRIGTNAIPFLLREVQATDPLWKSKLGKWMNESVKWFPRIPLIEVRRINAPIWFHFMGPIAEPAIPSLRDLIYGGNEEVALTAMEALWNIDDVKAVPILLEAATNCTGNLRIGAVTGLGLLRGKASSAIPVLLQLLRDPNAETEKSAAASLGRIALEPEKVVPLLAEKILTGNRGLRVDSMFAIGSFGLAAESAKPALQKTTEDADPLVREHAKRALFRIQLEKREGAIVRGPQSEKKIALLFIGHEFAEGGENILDELKRHTAKSSFFLTGGFLKNTNFRSLVRRLIDANHYLGAHSDKHLLYCDWTDEKKTLVSRTQFHGDLDRNNLKLYAVNHSKFITNSLQYFLPSYERYNREIADWTRDRGMTLISYTPGTLSNADYAGEADTNFVSSKAIFDSIVAKEQLDSNGLNGFLLLFHLGAGLGRADKFHTRFGELLDYLTGKGYQFVRVDELLEPKQEKQSE